MFKIWSILRTICYLILFTLEPYYSNTNDRLENPLPILGNLLHIILVLRQSCPSGLAKIANVMTKENTGSNMEMIDMAEVGALLTLFRT